MFGGVQCLMNHLQQHREFQPSGEVLYRVNCIVGRVAERRWERTLILIYRHLVRGEREKVYLITD